MLFVLGNENDHPIRMREKCKCELLSPSNFLVQTLRSVLSIIGFLSIQVLYYHNSAKHAQANLLLALLEKKALQVQHF